MARPVPKKPYESALRTSQARATRRAIVDAAAGLFVERGYGGTTVDAIAEAAGVSRKTVFSSVGGKVEALKLALDWAIVGDDEPVPMMERPQVQALRSEPDARKVVRGYVATFCAVTPRVAPIEAVVRGAAGLDDDVRALNEEQRRQRLVGMIVFATELGERGALREDLTVQQAGELLWTFNDPAIYHRLVLERGWAPERFQAWLAETLEHQLIAPAYRYRPASTRSGRR
jgi:AcrR family transcriptional regulator